jgi:PAS domain-containing protein
MAEPVHIHPPSVDDPVRAALDCLAEGFQIIDADWKYVYVNPAAARQGRREARALVGRPMMDAYPGIDQTLPFVVLRTCMEKRTSEVIENQFTFPTAARSGSSCASVPCRQASASIRLTSNPASARCRSAMNSAAVSLTGRTASWAIGEL